MAEKIVSKLDKECLMLPNSRCVHFFKDIMHFSYTYIETDDLGLRKEEGDGIILLDVRPKIKDVCLCFS